MIEKSFDFVSENPKENSITDDSQKNPILPIAEAPQEFQDPQ